MGQQQISWQLKVELLALFLAGYFASLSSAFVSRPHGPLAPVPSRRGTGRRAVSLPQEFASLDILLSESSLDIDIPVLSPTSALEAFAVLAVPLLLFAGLQLTRQGEGTGNTEKDDPINDMSTNDILSKLFKEVEGKEPTSMFSSSASPLASAKLDARGGAGGRGLLERPPAPAPVDEELRLRKARALEEDDRARTAAARAREEEDKALIAAAAEKAAAAKSAQEKERLRLEAAAKAMEARVAEEAKAREEAAAEALKKKEEEKEREEELRRQRETRMKEEAAKARAAAEARAAAAKAKREEEKEREQKRKLLARMIREDAAKKQEEHEKRLLEAWKEQELARRAERAQKERQPTKGVSVTSTERGRGKKSRAGKKESKISVDPVVSAAVAPAEKPMVAGEKEGKEWEEMRRLEEESAKLLELSPSARGNKRAFVPEGEFVKRGGRASVPVGVQTADLAEPAIERKVSKAEAEKERKELLMGLDAVMQDLQRRAEEKKGQLTAVREKKIAASDPASPPGPKKTGRTKGKAASAPAAGGVPPTPGKGDDLTVVARKLTVPKLKAILQAQQVKPSSSRAKKDELVRLVVALAVENPTILAEE